MRVYRPPRIVQDGLWSLLTNGGSKVFALGQVVWAGQAGGSETLGIYALGSSLALLGMSVADFGFALKATRAAAISRGRVDFRAVFVQFRRRVVACFALVLVGAAVYGALFDSIAVPVALLAAAYGAAYLAAHFIAAFARGLRMFREAAVVVGSVRTGAVVLSGSAVLFPEHAAELLLGVAVLTETTIALLLFRRVEERRPQLDSPGAPLTGGSVAFGVAAILNTAVNRSDAALVGSVTTLSEVGTYSAASQVENAVTTAAVAPSDAIVTHSAQAAAGDTAHQHYRQALGASLALAVVLCVVTAAVTILFLPRLIGIPDVVGPTLAVLIGTPAGVAASVALSHLSGLGRGREIVVVWLGTAVVAVPLMLLLAGQLGAMGAAYAAVGRDLFLMAGACGAVAYVRRDGGTAV